MASSKGIYIKPTSKAEQRARKYYPRSQASLKHKHMYMGRAWYLLSCDHDVIKIELEFLEQR